MDPFLGMTDKLFPFQDNKSISITGSDNSCITNNFYKLFDSNIGRNSLILNILMLELDKVFYFY